jgi:hypothetical protein
MCSINLGILSSKLLLFEHSVKWIVLVCGSIDECECSKSMLLEYVVKRYQNVHLCDGIIICECYRSKSMLLEYMDK